MVFESFFRLPVRAARRGRFFLFGASVIEALEMTATKIPLAVVSRTSATVFVETASEQAKRSAFLQKTRQDGQNAARFGRKYIVARKTWHVLMKNTPRQGKRLAFLQKTRRGKQNAVRFCRKHIGARKTRRVFAENAPRRVKRLAFSQKTRLDE